MENLTLWNAGDVVAWRGIHNQGIWHIQPTIVVKDSRKETVLALLPGAECMAQEDYARGMKNARRRWDFKDKPWRLEKFFWRTNRLLFLLEPQKYYSIIFFWNAASNDFLCYYINFQIPFQRSHCGIDTLDLDLDLVINPDFTWEWKDVDDYQKAIESEIILPEWAREIETAKEEILDRLEQRQYPFDGSWLDWAPDPRWPPPKLPENWDKI